MASADSAAQLLFRENSKEDFLGASELLLKLANNVLQNPHESKYRRIRIANPLLESKLLPVTGGLECLFDMGFQEDGEYLTLPSTSSLSVLREVRDELSALRSSATGQASTVTTLKVSPQSSANAQATSSPVATQPSVSQGGAAASVAPTMVPPAPVRTVQQQRNRESMFLRKLQGSMEHVKIYEDPNLQQKARDIIPVSTLQQEADIRCQTLQSEGRETSGVDVRDCLLLELLNWFKRSFFHWVDSPPCERCGGSTHHAGSTPPTLAEETWGGSRVENHRCEACGSMTRFPRYNHPGKLLETRRGRCGEWANCFTLCCRALGFEARYVLDWTDHVWTEVFSVGQKRWLHCDPCENVCDKPLLYEEGWGKKLTYIIAFSKDEVQDVSWRYSAKHAELLSRRTECRETWLIAVLHNIFRQRLRSMPETRQQEMLKRLIIELVEFITIKSDAQQLPGRSTGSLAWRQARGEVGRTPAIKDKVYVFRLLEEEKHSEVVHIKYSCAKDVYVRASAHDIETKGWQACVHSAKSVFRKEESDWKMAYLARQEDSATGEVSWKFDLSGEDLRISKLELKAASAVFENGAVTWRICSDDDCFSVPGGQLSNFMTFDLQRRQSLTITAMLTKGQGDTAWQHAQLFRQSLDNADFPLQIILHLN